MARYNAEAERERNRRKSVDFNDPLRFVRSDGGLCLKETAAHQLELAEKNRHLRDDALEQEKARKAAKDAIFEQDDLIMESLSKWSERRRSFVSDAVSGAHHSLVATNSDPSEVRKDDAIPEEDQTVIEASSEMITTSGDGEQKRITYGFSMSTIAEVNTPVAPNHQKLGRRASSFLPTSHSEFNSIKKLSSSSFHNEYPQQFSRGNHVINSQRSSTQSSNQESSGYGGSDDDHYA